MSQQMKIMQLISPAMVLFFGWNYAAGLALYWLVASLFAMFQQYFVTGWGSLLVAPNLISNKGNDTYEKVPATNAQQRKRLYWKRMSLKQAHRQMAKSKRIHRVPITIIHRLPGDAHVITAHRPDAGAATTFRAGIHHAVNAARSADA